MSIAHYEYFKLGRRKRWASWRGNRFWYESRGDRYENWTPAKPTKPIHDEDTYRVIYNNGTKEHDDVQMAWLWDKRKEWKIPNTATKSIAWRRFGWL